MDGESISVETLETCVKDVVSKVLETEDGKPVPYDAERTKKWCAEIISRTLQKICGDDEDRQSHHKYIVNVVISNTGSGLHINTGARWNPHRDIYVMIPYSTPTMNVVTTVYAVIVPGMPPDVPEVLKDL